jgi:hypothetical protein
MNRQLYGIGNLVEREQYGLGSSLKKFVRNIIPNEIASIASAAAPFVAPFNPLLAAGMAGLGNFDRTGSIGGSLKSAALTYGGGQLARGIGGAGFQTGINPFDAASLGQSASSFIGVPYSTPIGTTSGLQLGQYELFGAAPKTPPGIDSLDQVGVNVRGTGGFGADLKTIFSPDSNVGLDTRAKAVVNLSGDAIKAMYTNKDGSLDKKAILATLSAIPSYLDAKKKADQIGLSPNEFNEQIYNQEKQFYANKYTSNVPASSFGIRTTAAGGGMMDDGSGILSIKLTPRDGYSLGDLVAGSGIAVPVSGGQNTNISGLGGMFIGGGGGGLSGMISKLIQQNPQMFTRQGTSSSSSSMSDFIDVDPKDGIDDRTQKAKGGRMNYAMGNKIPMRQNQGGISELDLRAKGGYIPVGIKEKADDVPAMLSKNEFVFTADAVRGAGNGSINKGAQKMYKLMKSLEKKVKKTKVVLR